MVRSSSKHPISQCLVFGPLKENSVLNALLGWQSPPMWKSRVVEVQGYELGYVTGQQLQQHIESRGLRLPNDVPFSPEAKIYAAHPSDYSVASARLVTGLSPEEIDLINRFMLRHVLTDAHLEGFGHQKNAPIVHQFRDGFPITPVRFRSREGIRAQEEIPFPFLEIQAYLKAARLTRQHREGNRQGMEGSPTLPSQARR